MIKRYIAYDMVGFHPINFKLDPKGDIIFYEDIKELIDKSNNERNEFMGQYEMLDFLKKNAGKKFTVTELKKIFNLNNCSVSLRKLNMYGFIKSEPAPSKKGGGIGGLTYYYEKENRKK